VIDVGNDREVANLGEVHGPFPSFPLGSAGHRVGEKTPKFYCWAPSGSLLACKFP